MILTREQIEALSGLEPKAWIAVGAGYAREEIKALVLRSGHGLVAHAVTSAAEIASHLAGAAENLEPLSRQEALRELMADPRILSKLPELKRLRRQRGFFRRLDRAVQAGRLAGAHEQELEVQAERLESRFGANPLRNELRTLARVYEAWLEGVGLWDPPKAFRAAIEKLESGDVRPGLLPDAILRASVSEPESLELAFWEQLSRITRIESVSLLAEHPIAPTYQRWHTLDDACDQLAESLAALSPDELNSKNVVLIPDSAAVRRSLKRALADWRVPEGDPRDPNRLRFDEGLKWALLPLEVVARNFERDKVLAWVSAHFEKPELLPGIRDAAALRGVRQGLREYAGGNLQPLFSALEGLQKTFGGKKTCSELGVAHRAWIESAMVRANRSELFWLIPFFGAAWEAFESDLKLLETGDRRAGLLYWVERLSQRIEEMPAPAEKMRPKRGIRVYRLHQAPLESVENVWILGMPSHWLSGLSGDGNSATIDDYWLSAREREVLSSEFAVRSGIQARAERLRALQAWTGTASQVTVLDALYNPDGRERESIRPVLLELFGEQALPAETPDFGAHRRWAASYGALRPIQPQRVRLAPLPSSSEGVPEISATALDRASRCGMQGLLLERWKLWDSREPETELWPHVRGNLLHDSVKILLQNRNAEGAFALSSSEALERAWRARPPQGLIRSRRLESYLRSRLVRVLDVFLEKEREYFDRTRARVVCLDDREFRFRFPEFEVRGKPDRVDETDSGVFIMDYKASSSVPTGRLMLEKGYRLQLPFYALAVGQELKKPVAGVQFIQLTPKGSRSSGVFFKRLNGKEAGKLTALAPNNHSLTDTEPEAIWGRFQDHIHREAAAYVRGEYDALPKDAKKECPSCPVRDVCGYGRRVADGLEAVASAEEDA